MQLRTKKLSVKNASQLQISNVPMSRDSNSSSSCFAPVELELFAVVALLLLLLLLLLDASLVVAAVIVLCESDCCCNSSSAIIVAP